MVFSYHLNTEEMTLHVWETINWHLRGVAHPPRPLHENYRDLCLDFILADAKEVGRHYQKISKLVHTTFYAMVVNEALELAVLSRNIVTDLKSALMGLRWFIF